MSFHDNLKEAMQFNDISTKELAKKTNLSENTINSYLKSNGSIPNIITGLKIANALNVSVDFLVNGLEKTHNNDEKFLSTIHKCSPIIHKLSSLPQDKQDTATRIFSDICESYSK